VQDTFGLTELLHGSISFSLEQLNEKVEKTTLEHLDSRFWRDLGERDVGQYF